MNCKAWSWRHGFSQSDLSGRAKNILAFLSFFMDDMGGSCYPSRDDLCKYSGRDRKTVKAGLEEAAEAGWVKIKEHGYRGQKWRRLEYVAAWPERGVEGHHIDGENEPNSVQNIGEGGGLAPPRYAKKVGDIVPEGGGVAPPKVGDIVPQDKTSPITNPIPVQEREGASAPEKDLDENNSKPISKAELQKRLQRFVKGEGFKAGEWNGWAGSSIDYMLKHFSELSEDDRLSAETWRDAYLRECGRQKTKPAPVGNYFKSKQWEYLSDDVMNRSKQIDGVATQSGDVSKDGKAKPYSVPWMIYRMVHLMRGQEVDGVVCGSNPIRSIKDRAWPTLSKFDNSVAQNIALQLPERFHANNDAMVWVSAGSDEWDEWKTIFDRFGWPYIPNMFELDGANFPKGGPNELQAFAERMGVNWQSPADVNDGEAL